MKMIIIKVYFSELFGVVKSGCFGYRGFGIIVYGRLEKPPALCLWNLRAEIIPNQKVGLTVVKLTLRLSLTKSIKD